MVHSQNSHHFIKIYQCSFCSLTYFFREYIINPDHQQIHTTIFSEHTCLLCNAKLPSNLKLRVHILESHTMHENKIFCNGCDSYILLANKLDINHVHFLVEQEQNTSKGISRRDRSRSPVNLAPLPTEQRESPIIDYSKPVIKLL